jgi:hypothetical protein
MGLFVGFILVLFSVSMEKSHFSRNHYEFEVPGSVGPNFFVLFQVVLAIHELFPSLHLFLMLWGIFMGISLNLYIGRNIL